MTRIQRINGITHILWGLVLLTPLFTGITLWIIVIFVPISFAFIWTGLGVLKSKSIAWSYSLVLGFLVLIYFILSVSRGIARVADMRDSFVIIHFAVWTTLAILTLYSTIGILRKDMRMNLGIQRRQFNVTMIICLVTGGLWSIFLLNN